MSSVPRDAMRRRREALGFSQGYVAKEMGVAMNTYAGWELGAHKITLGYRPALARVLGVTMAEVASWFDPVALAPDGLSPTWVGTYAALEQGAADLWLFQPISIPGLMQTAAYATAVERSAAGSPTEEEVEQWVRVRMARQAVLDREPDPLRLSVVLDEAVLRRVAGDREVMAEQIDHLVMMAERPNVDVRVLPLDPGTHAGFGTFTLLTAPGMTRPYMLVLEDRGGAHYLERSETVGEHKALFEHLQALALSQADSIDLFRTVAQEYRI